MCDFQKYIEDNRDKISLYQQKPIDWARTNNEINVKENYRIAFQIISSLDFNRLSRQDVINAYQEDLYKGFVFTMLWGGKHLGDFVDFLHILSIDKGEIEEKLFRAKEFLTENQLNEAYKSFGKGEKNHIDNVGVSYYTKILFFLQKAYNIEVKPKPVIYDNNMYFVHAALLISKEENVSFFYRGKRNKNGDLLLEPKQWGKVYFDYCKKMEEACPDAIEPDKLEEFLFNNSADDLTTMLSPRDYVKRFVDNYFKTNINI